MSSYEDVFNRLSPQAKELVRLDLIRQVQGTLQAISQDRYETLRARYRVQSVLKQVLAQKRDAAIRPLWGSW